MGITTDDKPYEAVIIGGSYAGLSAALQLARARRRVAVIDAGLRRNRFAEHSHGFLTQDGSPAARIAEQGKQQLLAYPSVTWMAGSATWAGGSTDAFRVELDAALNVEARRLVLAPGVVDELPPVPGLEERWGRSVFHCPYCHGYELEAGHIGVLAAGPMSIHQALMLPHWGKVTFFTNQAIDLDEDQTVELRRRGVAIEPRGVARIVEGATVELADGTRVATDGLFTASRTYVAGTLPDLLGCAIDESPLGTYLRTDELKATTVPGVFACGDAARPTGNVAFAVGDGTQAGLSAHRSLLFP